MDTGIDCAVNVDVIVLIFGGFAFVPSRNNDIAIAAFALVNVVFFRAFCDNFGAAFGDKDARCLA